jgi:GNAT superfamily N-acetyltransferase
MAIDYRRAVPEDAERLLDLVRDIGWFPAINDTPRPLALERTRRHLALALADDSHSIHVAQGDDGRLLGYVMAHWLPYLILAGPEGYVSELFLREDMRGQGIGRRLLALVKDEARRRGCSRLSLINMSGRESYLRRFYAQDGWEERSDARNFVFRLG